MGLLDPLAGRATLFRASHVDTTLYHECAGRVVLFAQFCTTYGWSVFLNIVSCAKADGAMPFTIFFANAGGTFLFPILSAHAGWTEIPSRFLSVLPPMHARIVCTRNLFFVGQLHLPGRLAHAKAVLLLVNLLSTGLRRCQRQEFRRSRECCPRNAARRTRPRWFVHSHFLIERIRFIACRGDSQRSVLRARTMGSVVFHDPVWCGNPSAGKLQSMRSTVGQQRPDRAFYIQWGSSAMQVTKA